MTTTISDNITNSKGAALFAYALLSLCFLASYLWWVSLKWQFVIRTNHYLGLLLVLLGLGFLTATRIDKRYGWRLNRYFIVSIIQLLLLWLVANPIRSWQLESSYAKAQSIIQPLETYEEKYGYYPASLTELERRLKQKVPTRTNIGTPYQYVRLTPQDYLISFNSYFGFTAYYQTGIRQWYLVE